MTNDKNNNIMFEVNITYEDTNETVSYMFDNPEKAFEYFMQNIKLGLKCTLGTL